MPKKTTKKSKAPKRVKKRTYEHHPHHYNRSEDFLIQNLEEELKEAWFKLRAFGESLGDQRIYASGRAIMFSKKVCYFFVRPKKTFLEVVVFLKNKNPSSLFKIVDVSKTKFSHTFKLVHADQVEGELTEAIAQAYHDAPEKT